MFQGANGDIRCAAIALHLFAHGLCGDEIKREVVALNLGALPSDDVVGGVVRENHEFVCVEGDRDGHSEIAEAADKSPISSPSREFQVAADSRGAVDCHATAKGGGIEA